MVVHNIYDEHEGRILIAVSLIQDRVDDLLIPSE